MRPKGKNPVSKPVQIAIVVICLAGAAFFLFNFISAEPANSEDGVPDEYHYLCSDSKCGNTFSWTRGEDLGGRQFPDICPKCGAPDGYQAAKCDACGHYQMVQGHGSYEDPCPECGADMPPLGKH